MRNRVVTSTIRLAPPDVKYGCHLPFQLTAPAAACHGRCLLERAPREARARRGATAHDMEGHREARAR